MAKDKVQFLELSRLTHDSFSNRQRYEWRVSFSLWTAIGLVVYASVTQRINIFESACSERLAFLVLMATYIGFISLVTRGHHIDKAFKHYYMNRAEGKEATSPLSQPTPWYVTVGWPLTQVIFTAAIAWLALQLLSGVRAESRQSTSPATTTQESKGG